MKKFLVILFLTFALVACGKQSDNEKNLQPANVENATVKVDSEGNNKEDENSNNLNSVAIYDITYCDSLAIRHPEDYDFLKMDRSSYQDENAPESIKITFEDVRIYWRIQEICI